MKKQANILRFTGRSTGFLVLCLIWLVSVFGKIVPTNQAIKIAEKGKHSTKKTDKKSSSTQKEEKPQTTISELSLAVVSPSHAFSFVYDVFVLSIPQFTFEFAEKAVFKVEKPYFILSYFANTFEHHIAINAP